MAKSINQVTLMGNLTRDPELRQTTTGQNVTSMSLALNSSYKDKDGNWQEKADYIDVVAWGPLAERVAQYLQKGRRCLVQGKLQTRSWEQDGQKRTKVEVLAQDVTFLDVSGQDNGGQQSATTSTRSTSSYNSNRNTSNNNTGDEPINLDDIPF